MSGFLARQRYLTGDEVLILVGDHAGESGQVVIVHFGGSDKLAHYTVAALESARKHLGIFEAGHLRGLRDGALARGILRPSSSGALNLDRILTQIEAIIPEGWDFDLSRLGTNEGDNRYRAYAGDPHDGTSDLVLYGSSRHQAARRLRDALEEQLGPAS
jgi:hypothetical protein